MLAAQRERDLAAKAASESAAQLQQAHHEYQAASNAARLDAEAALQMHTTALHQEHARIRQESLATVLAGIETIDKARRDELLAEDSKRADEELAAKKRKV